MNVPRVAAIAVLLAMLASVAPAQTLTTELDVSAGYSTQDVRAAAMQLRAFGDAVRGLRYFAEVSAAAESAAAETDAFSSGYPYGEGLRVIEAYGEYFLNRARVVGGVRGGRFRTPFGIYNRGEHAYGGFMRAPLIRYDGYFALSNNYLEHGAAGFIGVSHLQVESSVGVPADVGAARRRSGVDATIRVQGFAGPLIVGVSHIRTQPYLPATFAFGRAVFTGIDGHWMVGGVQLRGEWLYGQPFDGTTTDGGYLDLTVHRPSMGPVTAVARIEYLGYDTVPRFALHARRATVGARIRLVRGLIAQLGVLHQTSQVAHDHPWALDAAITYSLRH